MIAKEMGMIFSKHADMMTTKHWTELLQQLEAKGLFVVIETGTNGRVLSPFGGLMPMPCKNETLNVFTAEELEAKGLTAGHHVVSKCHPVAEAK
ncbi:hypothetical protein EDM56_06770 [Brevibacillus fluminis]|uniref:Uncharacterized protein n=1 Tax=Brevibacillus fluminis TaxID=511487 RepID=A0A3M8DWB5_9BACL|nr:hypothetical protein [Brevibacillus fluminis]RNB91277.1 hypothetical protein EDM56_06770 [Brevibacillus fluminis]